MIRNPCRKCLVMPMCSEDCDLIRKWHNIKRILFITFKLTIDCCLVSALFILVASVFIRCMGEISK
jgi:hypothetical protein